MDNIDLFYDFTCTIDEIEKLEPFLDASQLGLLVSAQIMSDNLEVEILTYLLLSILLTTVDIYIVLPHFSHSSELSQ